MRKRWIAAGALVATAIGIGGVIRHAKSEREEAEGEEAGNERFERPKPDSRMRIPGTHRASAAELATRNRVGAEESAKINARLAALGASAKPSVPATSWVSLGPTDAPKQFNYFSIDGVDSGRPTTIVVDPRDANVVYVATSGGGVWKTYNFLAMTGPTWHPASDTLPNLAVGALAIDAAHPDTLYLGSGDFIDGSGNTMFKSTNGGGTWSAPIVLDGMYAGPVPVPAKVGSIREIAVDGQSVWVATDAGLFHSTDAGTSYSLVDLPEASGVVAESVWNIQSLGGGGWIASGVTACGPGAPPPGAFGQSDPGAGCPLGTNAAVWRTDDGTTWTQITTLPQTAGTNRTTLGIGPTTGPGSTVVYAFVGDLFGQQTLGFWRSKDGGKTWVALGGSLANPTLASNGDTTCVDLDVGHNQSWYNQAIVVDPTNADHVLVGGNLCGVRTLNGTSDTPVWENVSHWLPGTGFGETAGGRLSYVHADWHAAIAVSIGGLVRTFAGTDGGVFTSTNLWTAAMPEQVVWKHQNKGLSTHLFYSVASGDPATGNPFVLYGGLQDNGTRFRGDPTRPSAFNQAIGGDGIGGTVHTSASGTTYWASVQFQWVWCKPALTDCSVEQPEAQSEAESHWHGTPSPIGLEPEQIQERANRFLKQIGEDSAPFLVHYANVETDLTGPSVLIHTDGQVFVAIDDGAGGFTWKSISQELTSIGQGISNIAASRSTPGLYGAVGLVSAAPFFVTTQGNTKVNWTPAQPVRIGSARLTGASSIDFPPTLAAGQQPGQVFIGAFTGTLNSPDRPAPPDELGRLWRTTDGGATWTSIVGADPAHRLPNVPIWVVKYDPVTASTIYAGTDLGVYITTDSGATWNRMGDGLPMVPVRDMYVAKNQDFIRVATYGRGLWEIYPGAGAGQGAPGNGDYDRNLQLDWIDLAAMSTRQGVTPEVTAAPLYSWIMDITGSGSPPVPRIDADDLAAFLANFGGHP